MVRAYSLDLKERVARSYFRGETMRSVAETFDVSLGLVHRIVNLYERYGQATDPDATPRRGRRVTNAADEEFIRDLVKAQPSIYLDEIQQELESARGLFVSIATISRTLARMDISRKSLSRCASERNEELRTLWEVEVARLNDPDFFVFIDESAVDNKTVQRSQGWSTVGGRSVSRCTFLQGKRHSILPALSSDGIIALEIFEGSVNKERFLQFLRDQVAPQLNPFPGKRSVVIMDNCSIHHDEAVRKLIVDNCGARLIYLPPYSPDFNPIEEAFSFVKAWLRRHEVWYTESDQLPWLLHHAVAEITPEVTLGWFADCGYK